MLEENNTSRKAIWHKTFDWAISPVSVDRLKQTNKEADWPVWACQRGRGDLVPLRVHHYVKVAHSFKRGLTHCFIFPVKFRWSTLFTHTPSFHLLCLGFSTFHSLLCLGHRSQVLLWLKANQRPKQRRMMEKFKKCLRGVVVQWLWFKARL